jgi:nucleotide-binding universal stress UspA family protein
MHVNNNAGEDVFDTPEAKSINFALSGVNHKFHLVKNTDIVKAIDEFMKTGDREMLFMVIRKYNLIEALFHTSVTEKIAHHATLPMVVVHE